MTAAAAMEPTELVELMEAQAEAAHEREVGDATRPTAQDLAVSPTRIDVEGLDLFYGDHHALKDVSIKIRDKQITSFIGPSGCGKSTLLRCFNRMNDGIKDCRIEGKIALDGQNILGDYDICRLRQRVGMVFQRPNPFPMSIYDNVAYGPRGMGVRDRVVLDELVEDSLRRAALWDEVKDKLKETCTLVVVTHNMQQAARISDSVAFFLLGELVEHAPTAQLFKNPTDPRTADYLTGRFG